MTAVAYWDEQYRVNADHHRGQCEAIAEDFLRAADSHERFTEALTAADRILEVGCGTGDLLAAVEATFAPRVAIGVDPSEEAIRRANDVYGNPTGYPQYRRIDLLNEGWLADPFHLALCSQVLEHFRNPWLLLDRILGFAEQAIVIVPYRQTLTDDYLEEGGAGHAFTFHERSFDEYRLLDWFTFKTDGWSCTGSERQLAVLVAAR